MPKSGEELKRLLREAAKKSSPVDEFVSVVRELARYEQRYSMESADFYRKFNTGELGDAMDYIRWAAQYRMYQEMRTEIEGVFDALEQYALPVAA